MAAEPCTTGTPIRPRTSYGRGGTSTSSGRKSPAFRPGKMLRRFGPGIGATCYRRLGARCSSQAWRTPVERLLVIATGHLGLLNHLSPRRHRTIVSGPGAASVNDSLAIARAYDASGLTTAYRPHFGVLSHHGHSHGDHNGNQSIAGHGCGFLVAEPLLDKELASIRGYENGWGLPGRPMHSAIRQHPCDEW